MVTCCLPFVFEREEQIQGLKWSWIIINCLIQNLQQYTADISLYTVLQHTFSHAHFAVHSPILDMLSRREKVVLQ